MSIETYEPAPARALNAGGSRIEFLRERFEGAPTLDDGRLERSIAEYTAIALALARGGREIFPKEGVVDVSYTFLNSDVIRLKKTCVVGAGLAVQNEKDDRPRARKMNSFFFLRTATIKLQGRLKGNAFPGGLGLGVRLLGSVESVDVSLMVLRVMKRHDLT